MKKVKNAFIKISEHAWLTLVAAFIGVIAFLIGFYFTNISISRAEFNEFKINQIKELSEYRSDIKVIRSEIKNLSVSFRELKKEIKDENDL